MNGQNNATNSLAHTKWNCKYHIVFAPKYRRKVFYEEKRIEIREILRQLCQWKGYYVDTAGKNTKAIKEYIANQLKQDKETDQLTLFDPRDPFMGSKLQLRGWQANIRRTCAQPVMFRAMPENEKPPVPRGDHYCFREGSFPEKKMFFLFLCAECGIIQTEIYVFYGGFVYE